MTVKDLIEKLQELRDLDLPVKFYGIVGPERDDFGLNNIEHVVDYGSYIELL